MSKINVLPPFMADLIAAGEVVERPASVVKELLENAIDAGATACTVEIQQGGMTYIRVADNGCGMSREDARTAFLRHATSKIRNQEDLEHIGTLGFRGEALAAISAVSRVEMLTREPDAPFGTAVTVEGGEVLQEEDAACPPGTTMVVRDLFFNTPARMKFMKRDAAEAGAVRIAVVNEALSHPEVSIKYIRDGKEELYTAGDNVLKNCVYSVLGRDVALNMESVRWSGEDIEVTGFVGKPTACRGNRAMQYFFVNGRCIKAPALTASLEAAYKNRAMVGKFPVCVLMIKMKLSAVDVNVHPAKTEVRFFNGKNVCDAVYGAAFEALDGEQTITPPAQKAQPREDFFRSMTAERFREEIARTPRETEIRQTYDPGTVRFQPTVREEKRAPIQPLTPGTQRMGAQIRFNSERSPYERMTETEVRDELLQRQSREELPAPESESAEEKQMTLEEEMPAQCPPFRVVGEILTTYIVVEQEGKILLIDKHACHERILYDKIKASVGDVMRQTMLTPAILRPTGEEFAALMENSALLEKFGFELEDFGGGSIAVRTCPADMDFGQVQSAVEEIAGELAGRGNADQDARDHVLATVACKAAIKAGRKSDMRELEALVGKVLTGEVKYCPHGRPVAVEITKYKLDKLFGRV